MPIIPKDFISELLDRIDIVEIIGQRVTLKKSGNNYLACCPFHAEKTPSFSVSQPKQFYHCFGCGVHGNAIGFLMQYENLSFIAAVESLANFAGIAIPKNKDTDSLIKHKEFYNLLLEVSKYYVQELRKSQKAITYLKNRGLSGEICKKFRVGFAPLDWDNLLSISKNDSNRKKSLLATGMLIQKDNQKTYARFRNRIMYPITNKFGNIIGFGGRSLGDELPKYLNSPETPIYHKGSELYGLYEAKQANKKLNEIIVVEGYMDVIALAQHGITNVVATSGTAITEKQIQTLLKNTNNIIFCFDGDTAGKKAASRALESIIPLMREGITAKFLFMEETEDPDSLIRKKGSDFFLKLLKSAISLDDFFFQKITAETETTSINGRSQIIKNAQDILQKIPNGIYKELLLTRLSEITKIETSKIKQFNYKTEKSIKSQKIVEIKVPKDPIFLAITLLLHFPFLAKLIDNNEIFTKLNSPGINLFQSLIKLLKLQQNLTIGAILEYYRERPELSLLEKIAETELLTSVENAKHDFLGIIQIIENRNKEEIINALLNEAKASELSREKKLLLQKLITETKR